MSDPRLAGRIRLVAAAIAIGATVLAVAFGAAVVVFDWMSYR